MRSADLARIAHQAEVGRLALHARVTGARVRRGDGWWAVCTGVDSNDLNGVVSAASAVISAAQVADLRSWLDPAPACWLIEAADPSLTATLIGAGARPERSGWCSGRSLTGLAEEPAAHPVVRVASAAQLDDWLTLAAACGWIETDADWARLRELALAVGLEHPKLRRWVASLGSEPVGFATSIVDGDVVTLDAVGVLAAHRRRGVGRSLLTALMIDAAAAGAETMVSAPSPDGWALQQALGFRRVPVVADTCFYLPPPASLGGA